MFAITSTGQRAISSYIFNHIIYMLVVVKDWKLILMEGTAGIKFDPSRFLTACKRTQLWHHWNLGPSTLQVNSLLTELTYLFCKPQDYTDVVNVALVLCLHKMENFLLNLKYLSLSTVSCLLPVVLEAKGCLLFWILRWPIYPGLCKYKTMFILWYKGLSATCHHQIHAHYTTSCGFLSSALSTYVPCCSGPNAVKYAIIDMLM